MTSLPSAWGPFPSYPRPLSAVRYLSDEGIMADAPVSVAEGAHPKRTRVLL